jgi:formiminoglutamate deiminase
VTAESSWFAEVAMLGSGPVHDVRFTVIDGRFTAVELGSSASGARRLPGIVLPGFANAHSHAFHRALRGRTHGDGGTFWTWRERMYAVAARLDPNSYFQLARATYSEMALAGVTTVGEFHYLHHGAGGQRYEDENAMAEALRQAAAEAGVRLTLLDACYLAGGLEPSGHLPLDEVQKRFADRDADAWAARVSRIAASPGMRIGAAIHSVRAVPAESLARVVETAKALGDATPAPLHVHLSEQPAENAACQAYYGMTPTELLARHGVLGPSTTAVHATHLNTADVSALGASGTHSCFCPTTERDLADGIGPAVALAAGGSPLSLGSDQNAVIDLIEEARALESHERLATLQRGRFSPGHLLGAMTDHHGLGWPDAGRLAEGARADLVSVRLDTVRTAGIDPGQVLMAATAADVDTVVIGGDVVVEAGRHRLGDIAGALSQAIEPLWEP